VVDASMEMVVWSLVGRGRGWFQALMKVTEGMVVCWLFEQLTMVELGGLRTVWVRVFGREGVVLGGGRAVVDGGGTTQARRRGVSWWTIWSFGFGQSMVVRQLRRCLVVDDEGSAGEGDRGGVVYGGFGWWKGWLVWT